MSFYQILSVLGIPSCFTVLVFIIKYVRALRLGVQALLRAEMISEYHHWKEKGYAPIFAKENFENCYKQYHSLGANGMMDSLRSEFLQLPTIKPIKEE